MNTISPASHRTAAGERVAPQAVGQTPPPSFGQAAVHLWLGNMIQRLCPDTQLRRHLLQEALIRLWESERLNPYFPPVWHLQVCRCHVLKLLRRARRFDSAKSVRAGSPLEVQPDPEPTPPAGARVVAETTPGAADMSGLIEQLCRRLDELEGSLTELLLEGYTTGEVADELLLTRQEAAKCPRPLANAAHGVGWVAQNDAQPGRRC